MPEISDADLRQFMDYQSIGTPTEIRKKRQELEDDNKSLRDERSELRKQVPAEGQVLLSEEDANEHAEYKKLGTVTEITDRLEQGDNAQRELSTTRTKEQVMSFAQAAGLAEEAVDTLMSLPALKDAKFEVRTKKGEDDKEVQTPYITLAGEGEKAMSFSDAQEKVPVLKGLRAAAPNGDGKGDGEKPPVPFVKQSGDQKGKGEGENLYDKIRKTAEAKKETATKDASRADSVRQRMGVRPVGAD